MSVAPQAPPSSAPAADAPPKASGKAAPKQRSGGAAAQAKKSGQPKAQKVGKGGGTGLFGFGQWADEDGDGDVDFDDLGEALGASVDGEAQEDKFEHWPIYVVCQCILALGLWAIFAAQDPQGVFAKAGLDNLFPGATHMAIHEDCTDLRVQFHRWILYQYTHAHFSHVALNCLLVLTTGIYLETQHGWWRVLVIFNMGVFGGACNFAVFDGHGSLIGMSGGCYALIGMNLANLVMNWNEMRYRKVFLGILLVLMVLDIVNVVIDRHGVSSHDAHLGGYSVGVIAGILCGQNMTMQRHEKYIWRAALGIGLVLLIFAIAWTAQWPPRTVWDLQPWCWARQVYNQSLFEEWRFHCVRCGSEACISEFSAMPYIDKVNFRDCSHDVGWSYSEP